MQAAKASPVWVGLPRFEQAVKKLAGQELKALGEAGVDQKILLRLLADFVRPFDPARLKRLGHKIKELDRLASALDDIQKRVERLDTFPFPSAEISMEVLSMDRPPITQAELETIRHCADQTRKYARAFSNFLSESKRNLYRWRIGILSGYVQNQTGRPHDKELAALLCAGYEAIQSQKAMSADAMKKARQFFADTIRTSLEIP